MRQSLQFFVFVLVLFLRLFVFGENSGCQPGELDTESFSQCKGYAMRCNGSNLSSVPSYYPPPTGNLTLPLCLLDLSNNIIKYVNENSFTNLTDLKWLYLSVNNITSIHSDAFLGLHNLVYLNLSVNNLTWPDSFGKNVFFPLKNLTNINLNENPIKTFDGLDEAMEPMAKLEGIYIAGCRNCSFGRKFSNFSKLRTISLSGRYENSCAMNIVTNESVRYVPQIFGLWLSNCRIHTIEAGAFRTLKSLQKLDISYNEKLHFDGMNTALTGLRNSATLETLNVNRIHELYGRGTVLKMTHIENLMTLQNLTYLHMDLNKIEILDDKILNPVYQLPQSLRNFTLAGNRLTVGDYASYLYCITNLTYLDVSRQHLVYDPFIQDHFGPQSDPMLNSNNNVLSNMVDGSCHRNVCIGLPSDLKALKWRKSFMYVSDIPNIIFCGAQNLKFLDVSFNLLLQWTGVVRGMQNLKHIDLSDNFCKNVSSTFFDEFINVEFLNISGNRIGLSLDPENNRGARNTFSKLVHLKTLDLSRNYITKLPEGVFQNLISLEELYLGNNMLSTINFTVGKIRCLRYLDLSNNKLTDLPKDFTSYLDRMAETCNQSVTVNMFSNQVQCVCQTLDFFNWVLKSKIIQFDNSDSCRLKDGRARFLKDLSGIVKDLKKECAKKDDLILLVGLVVGVSTLVLTVIFCGLIYKYRWKLRYIYYNRHKRHFQTGFERLFENDAFVSYSDNQCSFIKRHLVPCLENNFDLQLWVADRNSRAGTSKAENIVHAITNSRKSILLVDRQYLKDHWCCYEMHMAKMESIESKRCVIIFVFLDKVSLSDLPVSVFKGLNEEECLRYPGDDNRQELNEFMIKLADEINAE